MQFKNDQGLVRPVTLPEVFGESLTVLVKILGNVFFMTILLYAPFYFAVAALGIGKEITPGTVPSLPQALMLLAAGAVGILLYFIQLMAIARMAEGASTGAHVSLGAALKTSFSRLPVGLLTGLLAALIIFGLTILLIVPGIIWSVFYTFIFIAVALRGKAGKSALAYSKALVSKNWWRVMLMLSVLLLAVAVVSVAVNFVSSLALQAFPERQFFGFIPFFIQQLINAFSYVTYTVFFLKLESLKGLRQVTIGLPRV